MAACDVLVVDDNEPIVAMLARTLRDDGYATETAANGREALERVERSHPRPVLLDLRMPVLAGFGLVRELRARALPVKLLVVSARSDAWVCAVRLQADGCLIKPFDRDTLLSEVHRLCAA